MNLKMIFNSAIAVLIILGVVTSCNENDNSADFSPPDLSNGVIANKQAAVRIGEAVLISLLGEGITDYRPFKAELIADSIWRIAGRVTGEVADGSSPYIELNKNDGAVISIASGRWIVKVRENPNQTP